MMRASTRLLVTSVVVLVCLLPTFRHAAQAQSPTEAKAGRIYVGTTYRLKPGGADSAIVAIDPATGDWQIIAETGDDVRLSPDRRTLVFRRPGDGIWKCEADGQFPFKISVQDDRSGRALLRPVWSPDSKHLVVTKSGYAKNDSKQVWQSETWQIDADGRNPIKLAVPDTDAVEDWSPDGQWFLTFSSARDGQLYLMKTDGTQERKVTDDGPNVRNLRGRFSPDGKRVVYVQRTRTRGSSIWTTDIEGGNATQLVAEAEPSVPDGAFWSPDGKQIAVVLFDWQYRNGLKVVPSMTQGAHRIDIMDANGSNRHPIPLKGEKLYFISSFGDWR